LAPLPGLVKDPSPPASETELSPITIPAGTTLITTLQHNKIIDYLSGDASPDFIPQAAIDSLVSDLAGKEPSLGFTPEDAANKGAVSGYAALDASQLLLLANFPSGTALQVLRRNAGDTALEFADPASGEVFTWTDDHDANTFDLLNMKQLTFADDAAPDTALASIYAQNTGNISINARATEFIFLRIAGIQEYTFGVTEADFKGNNIVGVDDFSLAGNIKLVLTQEILWPDNTRRLTMNSGGFVAEVPSGETHDFEINSVIEYSFSATALDINGNNIDNINKTIYNLETLTSSAAILFDFNNEDLAALALADDTTFSSSNLAIGKTKEIHITSVAAQTMVFPAGWTFYGVKPTTTIAGKDSVLQLTSIGSTDADVKAVFVEEV